MLPGVALYCFDTYTAMLQVFSVVSGCEWEEFLLELELCTRLAQMALAHHDNKMVCGLLCLELGPSHPWD